MKFLDLLKEVEKEKIKYLVVGGIAVNLHGIERPTKDVDLVVHLDRENLLKFIHLMTRLGYVPKVPVNAEDLADIDKRKDWAENKNMVVFSFYHGKNWMEVVDVFIECPLPFDEIYERRELICAGDFTIPVMGIPDLIQLKKQSGRLQDLADIRALEEAFQIRKENGHS